MAENTMIVLLADHGESMTDHRIFYDHYGLYDCTRAGPADRPLAGRQAARRARRIAPFRQLSDVTPTLLEAAGVRRSRRIWTAGVSCSK